MIIPRLLKRLRKSDQVKALVAPSAIHGRFLPPHAATPALSLLYVGDDPVNDLGGEDNSRRERAQIDAWAPTLKQADQLAKAAMAALASRGQDFTAVRNGKTYEYDDAAQLHRLRLDYSFIYYED
ncbi:hypothetical protein HCH_04549 [Hahella chejuensis KCTC 2396]|uniref:Uncharacterized protein n=1 Tax=Hahella chejuensis (strain KCTC 2396) TaxID=349521 RepID=Q2SDM5_HAHCH|nr:DUF3168 domain-containing protein [Hahella chejuensis]ABC31249.1 hypothetical protein HCH_04549 [Hahella chejuensis KCTC 2396]